MGGIEELRAEFVFVRVVVFLSFVEPRKTAPKTSPKKHAPTTTILRMGVVALSSSIIDGTSMSAISRLANISVQAYEKSPARQPVLSDRASVFVENLSSFRYMNSVILDSDASLM